MTVSILQGDALAVLRTLPSDHFHCVVTSPPYWGLRDYGTGTWEGGDPACDHQKPVNNRQFLNGQGELSTGTSCTSWTYRDGTPSRGCPKCGARRIDQQIGLEQSPSEWCARLVEVFREVRRVLRPDGVCFVNIGDSYASAPNGRSAADTKAAGRDDRTFRDKPMGVPAGLKAKDLVGQPWMLAFALRADGWWLRGDYVWAKPNPMPESVRDRCTKAHEYIFHLSKSATYFWDAEAMREPSFGGSRSVLGAKNYRGTNGREWAGGAEAYDEAAGRNLRSVWTIATEPLPSIELDGEKLDHFASYPFELARRCILAGTSAKGCCPECGAPWARVVERTAPSNQTTGWHQTCSCIGKDFPVKLMQPAPCRVLDPFGGSGRTALAAEELGRDCTLIELNPASVKMAKAQIERAKARRMIGDVAERAPVHPNQLGLFA